jgi:hypothetical protein
LVHGKKFTFQRQQFGFRKNRSTNDCHVILESEIQEAFANKQHLVVISFDLEKAYDTAWRYNIIRTLWNLEMKGNLFFFILNFIKNLRFRVLIGDTLSDVHSQENGIVQKALY